eukprot:TRINITY_DN3093_c3_g2_i2.p1 TRINITY_DN3093_c3_g2~~TRINITY_DN3093_c3_g2_i2.p1  ORF type:complete len:914 (+),score=209.05 TRINITY_DN3093_c3_g2_i2:147-2744(+)
MADDIVFTRMHTPTFRTGRPPTTPQVARTPTDQRITVCSLWSPGASSHSSRCRPGTATPLRGQQMVRRINGEAGLLTPENSAVERARRLAADACVQLLDIRRSVAEARARLGVRASEEAVQKELAALHAFTRELELLRQAIRATPGQAVNCDLQAALRFVEATLRAIENLCGGRPVGSCDGDDVDFDALHRRLCRAPSPPPPLVSLPPPAQRLEPLTWASPCSSVPGSGGKSALQRGDTSFGHSDSSSVASPPARAIFQCCKEPDAECKGGSDGVSECSEEMGVGVSESDGSAPPSPSHRRSFRICCRRPSASPPPILTAARGPHTPPQTPPPTSPQSTAVPPLPLAEPCWTPEMHVLSPEVRRGVATAGRGIRLSHTVPPRRPALSPPLSVRGAAPLLPHLTSDDSERPRKWRKLRDLGRGAFGRVVLGHDQHSGEMYAVKQIPIRQGGDSRVVQQQVRRFQSEIANMKRVVSCSYCVKYLGSEITGTHLNIFVEYASGGSVFDLYKLRGALPEMVVRRYSHQVLQGLEYLHSHGIIHRDVKGLNVLIDRGDAKLADFGSCKCIRTIAGPDDAAVASAEHSSVSGTPQWMAPEVFTGSEPSTLSDVWSVGCLIVEMAKGGPPWGALQVAQAVYMIGSTKTGPQVPPALSSALRDLLRCCFRSDASERPECTVLLDHRWFTGWVVTAEEQAALCASSALCSDDSMTVGRAGAETPHTDVWTNDESFQVSIGGAAVGAPTPAAASHVVSSLSPTVTRPGGSSRRSIGSPPATLSTAPTTVPAAAAQQAAAAAPELVDQSPFDDFAIAGFDGVDAPTEEGGGDSYAVSELLTRTASRRRGYRRVYHGALARLRRFSSCYSDSSVHEQ